MFASRPPLFNELHDRILPLTIALYRVTDCIPKVEILRNDLRAKANEIFQQVIEYNVFTQSDAMVLLLIGKVKTMKGFLALARTLNYVRPVNFILLEKEYGYIEEFLNNERIRFSQDPIDENLKKRNHSDLHNSLREKCMLTSLASQGDRQENRKNMVSDQSTSEKESNINHRETPEQDKGFNERKGINLTGRQKTILDYIEISRRAKISDFYTALRGVSSKTIQRDLQDLVHKGMLLKEGEKRWTIYLYSANGVQ